MASVVASGDTKKLPCTLLSGFLGAGKTSLLKNILENTEGLKCAVVVNDMAEVNIDASLVRDGGLVDSAGSLVEMQNGCICCTLREDLLIESARLAREGQFDYLVIESTGVSEPMQVAEAFTFDSEEAGVVALSDVATLDTCVTVVDTVNFMANWLSTESVLDVEERTAVNADTETSAVAGGAELAAAEGSTVDAVAGESEVAATEREGTDEDNRNIVDLLVDQIEFANVVLLNKVSSATKSDLKFIRGLVNRLNPSAQVIETDHSNVPLNRVVNTGLFDFEKASNAAGWLQELRGTHVPETEEYGISSFIYRARRPFHPKRVFNFLDEHFIIVLHFQEDPTGALGGGADVVATFDAETAGADDAGKDADGTQEDDLLAKRARVLAKCREKFGTILRSKGYMWLAHEHARAVEWGHAGTMVNVEASHGWFIEQDLSEIPEEHRKLFEADFEGEYGDRRQELVFIGADMDRTKLTACLDSCLVTPEEFAHGPEAWEAFEHSDWPAWLEAEDEAELEEEHVHGPECSLPTEHR
eukprot:m.203795 g.203795  ORF g.203795 m.203795 type:complete len:531 (-) comp25286_c0_seq5:142-1734(-)